tara:strand:- start:2583 stop:2753 length:171 start_codon:yes stop_codon:yes gene_type:complete
MKTEISIKDYIDWAGLDMVDLIFMACHYDIEKTKKFMKKTYRKPKKLNKKLTKLLK